MRIARVSPAVSDQTTAGSTSASRQSLWSRRRDMMSSPLQFVFLLSIVLTLTTQKELDCSKYEDPGRSSVLSERYQTRGDKFVDFDWELSKELNADKDNLVISPISLKVVLAMLYEGAGGKTADEIREALNLDNMTSALPKKTRERFSLILKSLEASKEKGENKIKIGTHVFIDKNTEPKERFQCILQLYYNSAMEKVDFSNTTAAVNVINNWASNVTEGHIQDLVSEAEAHSSTIMLLLNAVYFKGLWQMPFPENQTKAGAFYLNDKDSVNVMLMNTTDKFYHCNITELEAQLIKLPYLGEKFSMYVLLPNKKSGLNELVQKLGPNVSLLEHIKNMVEVPVNLIMPKFEFDFTTSLRPILEKLNIKTMFSPQAELSKIAHSRSGGLIVSNVLQKAGISVTEIGTVAYAATVVELMDKFGGGEEVVEFIADHPFLFFIEEETVKTTLFVGKVTNPEKAQVKEDKINIEDKISNTDPADKHPSSPAEVTTTSPPTKRPEDLFEHDTAATQLKFNYFDADLLKDFVDKEEGNFVFSPASIKTLLGLVVEGSEGTTQAELLRVLRLPQNMTYARRALSSLQNSLQKSSNSKVTVDSVAHIFIASTLKTNSTYAKTVKDYYKADVSPQDFTSPEVAANNINSWIRTRTGALISDLVNQDMITPHTYSILASAIYFDGKWNTEFPLNNTKDECFFSEPDLQCHMTSMMSKNEELLYKFDQSLDSHVLQIPYQDERFSMVTIMPRKKDGMKQLAVDAVRLTFPRVLENMNLFEVNLKMPRFSMDYGNELISTLKKLGLNEAFSDNAQLPYMINGRQSRVGAMVHKAKIEVSEKGTRAAAASAAAVVPLMFGLDVITLELNHPFFYFIYDQLSKTVLFAGRLSSIDAVGALSSSLPPSNAAIPLGVAGSGNQQTSYAMPTNMPRPSSQKSNGAGGSSRQPSYSPPANTFGSSSQPSSYEAPENAFGSSSQQSYSPPANAFGSSSQPSYANAASAGSVNRPTASMAASQPNNQASSGVETSSSVPKPSNHGAVNHKYNPQAPSAVPPKGHSYTDFEYPVSTDERNYAKYGSHRS